MQFLYLLHNTAANICCTILLQSSCDRHAHWMKASPWLIGVNPRDLIMPVDGDDGFYPTGNELVSFCALYFAIFAMMPV
jgi:hypothetical protein